MRHNFIVWVAIGSLLIAASLSAGTTGKIAGSIRDANTGEPLIGANVILKGTYLGASTDVDGYFSIIDVPVGEYTLEVDIIGYKTVVYPDVKVLQGQTTKVNFKLEEAPCYENVIVVKSSEPFFLGGVLWRYREEYSTPLLEDFSDSPEVPASSISNPVGNRIVQKFELLQNYPNPFNPETNIRFNIAKKQMVEVAVYNLIGELVAQLHRGELVPGAYNLVWNAANQPSGMYIVKVKTPEQTATRKMMLVK